MNGHGINRRQFLKGMASLSAVGALAACAAPTAPAPAAPAAPAAAAATAAPAAAKAEVAAAGPVTLNVWWNVNPTTQGVVGVFEKKFPNIKIALGDLGEAVYGTPKYVTAVAAGKGPDVSYQNRHTFRQFASKGLYLSVEDLMTRDNIKKSDFMAGPIKDLTWDGKLYGLPHTAGTRFLFWNKKHFEEAGLDPNKAPETWDDIAAWAPKLTKKDGDKITRYAFLPNFPPGLSDQLLIFAMENGGVSQDETGHTIMIDTDPWVEALQWSVDMVDKYAGGYAGASSFMGGTAQQPIDPFAQGQVAICSYGNWMIGEYAKYPDLSYDGTGLMPVSGKLKGSKVNWSCGWTFVMDPNAKQAAAGWEFLKWVIGSEYVMAAGTVGLDLTTKEWERQKLPGKPIFADTPPVYLPAMEVMKKEFYSKLPPNIMDIMNRYLDSENFAVGCGTIAGLAAAELWTSFKNAWEAALSKKSTPKDALVAAKADAQKALDAAWAGLEKKS